VFDSLAGLNRTHSCGVLRAQDEGREVVLMGWVQRRRDHGGLVFVDLRDREGLTQVVFNPEINLDVHNKAGVLRDEFVLAVRGLVNLRPPDMVNPQLDTGEIEVVAEELRLLNSSKTPPFELEDFRVDISDALRLKYRYLDLRRPSIMKPILFRHRAAQVARRFLNEQGFIEVETPILTKSTPEGARDYLVPSRVQAGFFYALPQSPQLFKQLLMMSGLDRYYQICRCFRDEDLRADRQPEFTQIDMEMAFISEEDIYQVVEGLIVTLLDETVGVKVAKPFPRLTFQDCLARFGLDRPDTRFGLELSEVSQIVTESNFRTFKEVVVRGAWSRPCAPLGWPGFPARTWTTSRPSPPVYGAKGLAWVKLVSNGWQSPLAKYFPDGVKTALTDHLGAREGDIFFFVADAPEVANTALGQLRLHLAQREGLIPEDTFNLVWVTDFPLLEYDLQERRYAAMHHPFTAPQEDDIHFLESDPGRVRARAYDLVLNGQEIGGGSIRNFRRDVQEQVFKVLGILPGGGRGEIRLPPGGPGLRRSPSRGGGLRL
jgi:aspartyl-tRNA synthetase